MTMTTLWLSLCLTASLASDKPSQQFAPQPLEHAEALLLDVWDITNGAGPLPEVHVAKQHARAVTWLKNAMQPGVPPNPFVKGSRDHKEAETTRAFLVASPDKQLALFDKLTPVLSGTRLALWRWGQARVRQGEMPKALRHAWEDLLIDMDPNVISGLALRHALCFALAEKDEARFRAIRERRGQLDTFQRAFALLGSPAPVLRLWRLPEMEEHRTSLADLGQRKLLVIPMTGAELPAIAPNQTWIAVSEKTDLPTEAANLEGPALTEAQRIATQLRETRRTAFLAPSRAALENLGILFFPAKLALDPEGRIQSIHMGDAAYTEP